MSRALEGRLAKLEAIRGQHERRLHVIDGDSPEERKAHIAALIRSGVANERDLFVVTGVPRAPGHFGAQLGRESVVPRELPEPSGLQGSGSLNAITRRAVPF